MEPKLVEKRVGDAWTTRWMCEPPAPGVGWRVLSDEWNDEWNDPDQAVRTIYEVKIIDKSG